MSGTHKGLEIVMFMQPAEYEAWLDENHLQNEAVWMKLSKKASPVQTIDLEQARDCSIRYGWIDGLINKLDEHFYLLRFAKRRPRSKWSKKNVAAAERLLAEGTVQAHGLREIEAAKADGRWGDAYAIGDPPPEEFQCALNASPAASAFFATLSDTEKFYFNFWIRDAKREATRDKRIEEAIARLSQGKKRGD